MHYCLVLADDIRQFDFACKRDLIDWFNTHKPMLTEHFLVRLSVYRARAAYPHYVRLHKLCSLKDFIVKHKLM
jgi:hypothetical protein|nr:MAG TPA: hypothetical protein [Microviridae sp.]